MPDPTLLVHRDADVLAEAVCARLLTRLVDIQAAGRTPRWVLTGGTVADTVHRAVARSPAKHAVDWSRVELWWGDERFVASRDRDRNDLQAREALLDAIPVSPALVHPMPAKDSPDADPDSAAEQYAAELAQAAAAEDHDGVPVFDVLMLGVGPDGHVASLFPERPALYDEGVVVAVRGAPKPPPTRLSLTMRTLQSAREVWFVVAGEDKAAAVRMTLSGAGVTQVPAAGPRGRARTLWLLDKAAAAELPAGMSRIASP